MTPRSALRSHQQGNVVMLTAISLAVLIGFLGIVIDLGRLFVTKTELQSAVDACALAAAAELRPGVVPPDPQAVNRAVSAALTPEGLVDLNVQSTVDQRSSADIATEWLTEQGLI